MCCGDSSYSSSLRTLDFQLDQISEIWNFFDLFNGILKIFEIFEIFENFENFEKKICQEVTFFFFLTQSWQLNILTILKILTNFEIFHQIFF